MRSSSPIVVTRRLAGAALLLALLAGGCGGDSTITSTTTAPETVENVSPEDYLLATADIERLSSAHAPRGAVSSALEFWRAIQYQNYAAAYIRLNGELRRAVRYETFLNKLATARGYLFLVEPIVEEVRPTGNLTTVYLRLQRGDEFSGDDQIIGFNMSREGGRWVIATDPYNLFRLAPG